MDVWRVASARSWIIALNQNCIKCNRWTNATSWQPLILLPASASHIHRNRTYFLHSPRGNKIRTQIEFDNDILVFCRLSFTYQSLFSDAKTYSPVIIVVPIVPGFRDILSFSSDLMWFRFGNHIDVCKSNEKKGRKKLSKMREFHEFSWSNNSIRTEFVNCGEFVSNFMQ